MRRSAASSSVPSAGMALRIFSLTPGSKAIAYVPGTTHMAYTVMVSTRPKSGYKKVKTVGKNVSSVTISKLRNARIKNGKKYYVYVITNKRVGGKTYTSGRLYYWNTKDGANSFGNFD